MQNLQVTELSLNQWAKMEKKVPQDNCGDVHMKRDWRAREKSKSCLLSHLHTAGIHLSVNAVETFLCDKSSE